MAGEQEKSIHAGLDGYDTKPVDLPRLLSRIEALLPKNSRPERRKMSDALKSRSVGGREERALLAHMRHELRTPINAIIGYSEMLLEDADACGTGDFGADLERILASGRELLALVGDILDPSKIESRGEFDVEAFNSEVHYALRTPITTVIGYCEALEEAAGGVSPGFLSDLGKIHRSAQKLLALIDDVVSLSKFEAGKANPALESTRDSGMIRELISTIPPLELGGPTQPGTGSLLIVDDNQVDRDLLARRLEREGYTVLVADNGREALEVVRSRSPDVVLLDIIMPEMNGYQTLENLKADRATRHIPVIMLSSWDEMDSMVRCIETGAEDYLSKPYNLALLKARIGSCLERKRSRDREVSHLRQLEDEKSERYGELVGKDSAIKKLQRQIEMEAALHLPLVIEGGKGTGKELIARLIHRRGHGDGAPLLSADCRQIAETPWGDKLLGDASPAEAGQPRARSVYYMDVVDGGTILLRDIDGLPSGVQERLARFLDGDPLLAGRRHTVRVIATCTRSLTDVTAAGQIVPALAKALGEHVITVPPLRDRKRDIPEIARYCLLKQAKRLNKAVLDLDDQAIVKLVTYDYSMANVVELKEAVERAVILADGTTVRAEEVFLGLGASARRTGFNLLSLPAKWVKRGLKVFPASAQMLTAIVFAFILFECFFGSSSGGGNPGTFLTWCIWWPSLVLGLLLFGRLWCAVCPMGLAASAMQRFAKKERRIPAWLKKYDSHAVMAGFFLILWAEEVTRMRQVPSHTGLLLCAILGGALTVSLLAPRRTWCRHLCPLGGFSGLCSTSAVMELRPTFDVCSAKCKGHSCYTGNKAAAGCPMFQHLMFVDSNEHCVLCMKCVGNCQNSSPRLNFRPPASELWTNVNGSAFGRFAALLLGLLLAQALIQRWELRPWGPVSGLLEGQRALFLTALFMVCAAVPLLGASLAAKWVRRATDPGPEAQFWRKVSASAPLVAAGFAAYQLGWVPGLPTVEASLGLGELAQGRVPWISVSVLSMLRVSLLLWGLGVTLLVLFNLSSRERTSNVSRLAIRQAPWWIGATSCCALLGAVMIG